MVFFVADSHFNHTNIIRYCNRPFDSVEAMNQTIIDNLNAVVMPKDVLYHLGDFSFGPQNVFREQINCQNIILVKGNHDKQIQHSLFVTVKDMVEFNGSGCNIVLCHYSMRVWNKAHHGSWSLFGHSHGTLEDYYMSFDCGVDTNNFKPYSLDDVADRMKAKIDQPLI